jgi:ketopantoate reductase
MEKPKIAIIGIGGKTATMFAFEMRNFAEILGVGEKEMVEKIKMGEIFLQRGKEEIKFEGKVIAKEEFNKNLDLDFIFFCVKNPVVPAINHYYSFFKESKKIPSLILSQNGIFLAQKAKEELEKIFSEKVKEITILRVNLFNPIFSQKENEKIKISYSLPIFLSLGVAFGPEKKEIKEIFKNFKSFFVKKEKVEDMEFSKLFLNLIGMASATRGLKIKEGFKNKEILKEEVLSLKEYIKVVRAVGGNFLNFPFYRVKFLASLVNFLPLWFFSLFRNFLGNFLEKERKGKIKDLAEIEYYNGAVVELARKLKIATPTNEKILKRGLEILKSGRTPI